MDSSIMYIRIKGKPHFYIKHNDTFIEFHNKKELSWYSVIWYQGIIRNINNSLYNKGKKIL